MEALTSFNYLENKITFTSGSGVVYVNATEMAKPFGKLPKDYLNKQTTKAFIKALEDDQKEISPLDLIIVHYGGANPGTWMHEDVALDFAQWLSPAFKVWCNKKIKQLLQTGTVNLKDSTEDEIILKAMYTLQNRIEEQTMMLEKANEVIQQQAPKIKYFHKVIDSVDLIPTNIIAKELGISAKTLNQSLKEKGIQYKQNGTWILYAKYQNKGYTGTKTHVYNDSEGKQHTNISTYWTEKGRAFVHDIFTPFRKSA